MNVFDKNGLIDSDVQEILYELGNVGLGMASITIGKIIGLRMHIGVPAVVPAKELFQKQNRKQMIVGVLMDFQVSMEGSLFFVLDEEFVNPVIEHFCNKEGVSKEDLDEADKVSALEELANIIAAAYLKAIGEYTGIRIFVRPVWLKIKPEDELIEEVMKRLEEKCEKAISIETSYSIEYKDGTSKENIGRVVMLPDAKSVEKLAEPLLEDF